MINHGQTPFEIKRGDRVAQMVINKIAQADFLEVDNLDVTSRSAGGFGSTGRQ
jgi:dUTP pyrophosphatase